MKIIFNTRMLAGFDKPSDTEVCALLLGERVRGGWIVDAVAEMPNKHPYPDCNYRILSQDAVELIGTRRCKRVIGAFHTHPRDDAEQLSTNDIELIPKGFLGAMYHPFTDMITYYNNNGVLQQMRCYV